MRCVSRIRAPCVLQLQPCICGACTSCMRKADLSCVLSCSQRHKNRKLLRCQRTKEEEVPSTRRTNFVTVFRNVRMEEKNCWCSMFFFSQQTSQKERDDDGFDWQLQQMHSRSKDSFWLWEMKRNRSMIDEKKRKPFLFLKMAFACYSFLFSSGIFLAMKKKKESYRKRRGRFFPDLFWVSLGWKITTGISNIDDGGEKGSICTSASHFLQHLLSLQWLQTLRCQSWFTACNRVSSCLSSAHMREKKRRNFKRFFLLFFSQTKSSCSRSEITTGTFF